MNNLCIKCNEGPVAGNAINHVGAHHKDGVGKTFIHINCRNYLNNNSRPKRSASSEDVQRNKKNLYTN